MSDFLDELDRLNHIIFNIIDNMSNGDNSRSDIEYLFSQITNLRQKYEPLSLDSDEIEQLERLITNNNLERDQLRSQFVSLTEEFRTKAIDEFGETIGSQLTERLWVHQGLTIIKLEPNVTEKLKMPDFKQILERVDKNLLMINNLNTAIERLNNRKTELDNISRTSRENIEFLDSFRIYCNQLITNYKNVVTLSNKNNRLFQVKLIHKNEIHTCMTDTEELDALERNGRAAPQKSDHVYSNDGFAYERQFPNLFDVFDETDDYYYGIYDGQIAFTRKKNCVKIDNPTSYIFSFFPFFVMTNRQANQILLGNYLGLENATTSCALLLFEFSRCVVLDPKSFTYHSYFRDDVPGMVPECSHSTHLIDENTLKTSLLSLSMHRLHNDFDFMVTYNQTNFKGLLCRNFISLLKLQDRNVNKKVLLQNMKCLFTKTARDQVKLYSHIDSQLTGAGSRFELYEFGSLYTDRSETLLDIFIPEIKFLLFIRSIFALRVIRPHLQIDPVYLQRWEMYLAENNLGKDATPLDYLTYLCRDVLSNQITPKIYKQIMALTSNLTMLRLDELFPIELNNSPTYLFQAIRHIVNGLFRDNKNGGKHIRNMKSKKKRLKNKKSRK